MKLTSRSKDSGNICIAQLIDKKGDIVDYLLTAKRFICKAIKLNAVPLKINIDKSGANAAGIKKYSSDEGSDIEIRQ